MNEQYSIMMNKFSEDIQLQKSFKVQWNLYVSSLLLIIISIQMCQWTINKIKLATPIYV